MAGSTTCYRAAADSAALAGAAADPRWVWFYGERADDTLLVGAREGPAAADDLTRYRHGRFFGPDGELAWWRTADGGCDCRFLGDGSPPAGLAWDAGSEARPTDVGDESATLLHGLWDLESADPPTWSEARVPRRFAYPLAADVAPTAATRVVLRSHVYTLPDTPDAGIVSRLVAVDTMEVAAAGGGENAHAG